MKKRYYRNFPLLPERLRMQAHAMLLTHSRSKCNSLWLVCSRSIAKRRIVEKQVQDDEMVDYVKLSTVMTDSLSFILRTHMIKRDS